MKREECYFFDIKDGVVSLTFPKDMFINMKDCIQSSFAKSDINKTLSNKGKYHLAEFSTILDLILEALEKDKK